MRPRDSDRRGHYKVFLGMAAGVGKTYRMLQEGQAEAEAGRDVVIGYLEPHDRPETIGQAGGLEVVPRRRVTYRDTELEEMDLPAVLAPRARAGADRRARPHQRPRGRAREALRGRRATCSPPGSTSSPPSTSSTSESLNDQVAELTGVAGPRDGPRRGARRRPTRSC